MDALLEAIRRVAVPGRTEEDLKMAMEPGLQRLSQAMHGVTVQPSYEVRTGLSGRRDAVYGHFTLEYKRPGFLASEENVRRAAQQLAEYLEAVAGKQGGAAALKRVAGACTDGQRIFFLRYWPREVLRARQVPKWRQESLLGSGATPGGFQMLGAYPVTRASLEELFRFLRALSRKPLVAEALAERFGPGAEVARGMVKALYSALGAAQSDRVRTLYRQWEHTFGVVYGEETSKAEEDVPELARGYDLPEGARLKPALFAVHTYFALIMKLLAAEILALQEGSLAPSLLSELLGLDEQALRSRLARLEAGDDFRAYGIRNFLEGDFFRWYLDAWGEALGSALQAMVRELSDFEPATPVLRPDEARDLLKKLYQYLVPKKLRHDLGEYYTPDWLAERLLNQVGYDGNPNVRLLDPACGSGTFLALALARLRQRMEFEFWDRDPKRRRECAEKALRNIVGFDLNPLAVIAARTNYLLAFGDLLRDVRPVELPVYNCDSVLTPVLQRREQRRQGGLFGPEPVDYFYLPTVEGNFRIPAAVLQQQALGYVTSAVEECVTAGYSPDEFLARVGKQLHLDEGSNELLRGLYQTILGLERDGKNGIWARLLKNAFAPVLQGQFDLVVGNPPWVNWEHLPESYRKLSKRLWAHYGLFSLKGHEARLGGGKKDLAMLFTYAAADHYLKPKGQLGFVITQTVFKTKGAGDGFRRFRLGRKGTPLRVKAVDDLANLQPFEGATNRTAILILVKSEPTRYPVMYMVWRRRGSQRIAQDSTLQEALARSTVRECLAEPVDPANPTSPWLTAKRYVLSALRKAVGESSYRAYAGSCTWLNGVYWVRILERRPDGLVVVENLGDAKNKIPRVRVAIEPDLLYPLLRGRNIRPWHATTNIWILLPQDPEKRSGWPEPKMKAEWPQAYQYLKRFEERLRRRSGFRQYFDSEKDPFWSIYNVGPYTMAPYKVVWREQARLLTSAVVSSVRLFDGGPDRVVVPDHKVFFIPTEHEDEALFLAGVLASSIVRMLVKGYTLETSISTHLMKFVRIPPFRREESSHRALATVAAQLHRGSETGAALQDEIDHLAAELWGLSERELRAVQEELGSAGPT